MKKSLLVLIAAYLLIAASWALVQGTTLGKDVEITGKAGCAYCGFSAGACTRGSCRQNVTHGTPVVLTDATGNRYMLIGGKKEKLLLTDERKGLLQETITVRGKLVKRGGIQGIFVKSMEKAS